MELDEELCLCFHVTKRKVVNYLRIEQPKHAAQLTECYGAGTGCGWCRPYLRQLFDAAVSTEKSDTDLPDASQYKQMRAQYVRQGKGTPPPGATPIE